ncbi:MAG: hypothetical protein WA888_16755, partial [Burkholderiaceae bacterium]
IDHMAVLRDCVATSPARHWPTSARLSPIRRGDRHRDGDKRPGDRGQRPGDRGQGTGDRGQGTGRISQSGTEHRGAGTAARPVSGRRKQCPDRRAGPHFVARVVNSDRLAAPVWPVFSHVARQAPTFGYFANGL